MLCSVVDCRLDMRKICRCVGRLFYNDVVDCMWEGQNQLNVALLTRIHKGFSYYIVISFKKTKISIIPNIIIINLHCCRT